MRFFFFFDIFETILFSILFDDEMKLKRVKFLTSVLFSRLDLIFEIKEEKSRVIYFQRSLTLITFHRRCFYPMLKVVYGKERERERGESVLCPRSNKGLVSNISNVAISGTMPSITSLLHAISVGNIGAIQGNTNRQKNALDIGVVSWIKSILQLFQIDCFAMKILKKLRGYESDNGKIYF